MNLLFRSWNCFIVSCCQIQIQTCITTSIMSSEFFNDNFSVFGQIEISLSGQDCFGDIHSTSN